MKQLSINTTKVCRVILLVLLFILMRAPFVEKTMIFLNLSKNVASILFYIMCLFAFFTFIMRIIPYKETEEKSIFYSLCGGNVVLLILIIIEMMKEHVVSAVMSFMTSFSIGQVFKFVSYATSTCNWSIAWKIFVGLLIGLSTLVFYALIMYKFNLPQCPFVEAPAFAIHLVLCLLAALTDRSETTERDSGFWDSFCQGAVIGLVASAIINSETKR